MADLQQVTIRVPVDREARGEIQHVDVRLSSPAQRQAMHGLLAGLRSTHAQTADGRHVDTAAQAIRYGLEQIAAAAQNREEIDAEKEELAQEVAAKAGFHC